MRVLRCACAATLLNIPNGHSTKTAALFIYVVLVYYSNTTAEPEQPAITSVSTSQLPYVLRECSRASRALPQKFVGLNISEFLSSRSTQ